MGKTVESDGVAFGMFAGDKFIVAGASDEEGDFNVILFEDIEKFSGVGTRAVVKSEVDNFLAGFFDFGSIGDFGDGGFFYADDFKIRRDRFFIVGRRGTFSE